MSFNTEPGELLFVKFILYSLVLLGFGCDRHLVDERDKKFLDVLDTMLIYKDYDGQIRNRVIIRDTTINVTFSRSLGDYIGQSYNDYITNVIFDFDGPAYDQGDSVKTPYIKIFSGLRLFGASDFRIRIDQPKVYIQRSEFFGPSTFEVLSETTLSFGQCWFKDTIRFGGKSTKNNLVVVRKPFSEIERLEFNSCTFFKTPIFKGAKIDSSFRMTNCRFYCDSMEFYRYNFGKAPSFDYLVLPEKIIFNEIETSGWVENLDLRTCIFNDSLKNPKRKRIVKFKSSQYMNPADLDGSKFLVPAEYFDIEFNEQFPVPQRQIVIGQIRDNCAKNGMIESAHAWDIQYKEIDNVYRWGAWGRFLNFIQNTWWDFGYAQWKLVVIWMPFFFCVFWIINFLRIRRIVQSIYFDGDLGGNFVNVDALKNDTPDEVVLDTAADRWSYSFFLTAVLYFGFKLKHEAVNYRNGWGMAYVYLVYFVGLFHVAYAVGFLLR